MTIHRILCGVLFFGSFQAIGEIRVAVTTVDGAKAFVDSIAIKTAQAGRFLQLDNEDVVTLTGLSGSTVVVSTTELFRAYDGLVRRKDAKQESVITQISDSMIRIREPRYLVNDDESLPILQDFFDEYISGTCRYFGFDRYVTFKSGRTVLLDETLVVLGPLGIVNELFTVQPKDLKDGEYAYHLINEIYCTGVYVGHEASKARYAAELLESTKKHPGDLKPLEWNKEVTVMAGTKTTTYYCNLPNNEEMADYTTFYMKYRHVPLSRISRKSSRNTLGTLVVNLLDREYFSVVPRMHRNYASLKIRCGGDTNDHHQSLQKPTGVKNDSVRSVTCRYQRVEDDDLHSEPHFKVVGNYEKSASTLFEALRLSCESCLNANHQAQFERKYCVDTECIDDNGELLWPIPENVFNRLPWKCQSGREFQGKR